MVKKLKIFISIFIVFLLFINITGCSKGKEEEYINKEFSDFITIDMISLQDNNVDVIELLNEIKFNTNFVYIDKLEELKSRIKKIEINTYIEKLENINVTTIDDKQKENRLYWLNQEKLVLSQLLKELNKENLEYNILEDLYNQLEDINLQLIK